MSELAALLTEMTGTHSAVHHGHVVLVLVAGHGQLPLPVEPRVAGHVAAQRVRRLLQLHALNHLHQSKVLVQLPHPVVAEKGLLPVEGARDEPILSGQSEQTLVAEGVPAEEQPRNLVPMQLEGVLENFL